MYLPRRSTLVLTAGIATIAVLTSVVGFTLAHPSDSWLRASYAVSMGLAAVALTALLGAFDTRRQQLRVIEAVRNDLFEWVDQHPPAEASKERHARYDESASLALGRARRLDHKLIEQGALAEAAGLEGAIATLERTLADPYGRRSRTSLGEAWPGSATEAALRERSYPREEAPSPEMPRPESEE